MLQYGKNKCIKIVIKNLKKTIGGHERNFYMKFNVGGIHRRTSARRSAHIIYIIWLMSPLRNSRTIVGHTIRLCILSQISKISYSLFKFEKKTFLKCESVTVNTVFSRIVMIQFLLLFALFYAVKYVSQM